ncbi:GGDEF domain-containing protein [Vibrio rotiferianus]|uniref:GGDEF domain-containing protein n=1 Tax=Vibrio rotiferianus TaxID=190895 RepID=UPI003397EDA7
MSVENLEYTERIRNRVLSAVTLIFTFVMLALVTFNVFYNSQYLLAFIEGLFAFLSLYIFFKCRKGHCHPYLVFFYLLSIALLILTANLLLPLTDVVFLWAFFFPTISYLLLGGALGFKLTTIVFVSVGAVLLARLFDDQIFDYGPVTINFATCYITIWCVTHFFELSRAKANTSLSKLALTDALTGTSNRLAFTSSFASFVGDYLLMFDIDDFKHINDEHGHDIGDKALSEIGGCLKAEVGNERVFRVGGEEFCVWISAKHMSEAITKANRLREAISNIQLKADSRDVYLTLSGGLVKNEYHTESDLLKYADQLMYQAKMNGKDQITHCAEAA